MPNNQCTAQTQTGLRCGAFAVNGADTCFSHTPELAEKKRSAVEKGGLAVKRPPLPALKVEDILDARKAAIRTLNDIRAGKLPASEGNTCVRLIKTFMQTCGMGL